MRRAILALATAIAITVSPLSAVVAVALDCSSTAKNYAQSPTATNSVVMNLCYESNGKGSTATSCQNKLNEANKLFTDPRYELFRGLGNGAIAEYNNCRNASGNKSNTNSGNLNSNVNTVVPSTCTGPPSEPVISSRFVMKDLKVSISAASTGSASDAVRYSVTIWTKQGGEKGLGGWSSWTPWVVVNSGSELTFSAPGGDETAAIYIDSYSSNACGNSPRTKLQKSFWNSDRDSSWQRIVSAPSGSAIQFSDLMSTVSGLPFSIEILTPDICSAAAETLWVQKPGTCRYSVKTAENTRFVPETKEWGFLVKSNSKTITCYKKGNSKVTKKVKAVAPKCPTGYSTKK
jgi:hypothetical protein